MHHDTHTGYFRLGVRMQIAGLKREYSACLMEILYRAEEGKAINIRAIASDQGIKYATLYDRIGRAMFALARAMREDEYFSQHFGNFNVDETINVVARLLSIDRVDRN